MNADKELISKLSSDYKNVFNEKEIREILDIDYMLKDGVALNTGSHLELNTIRLSGNKSKSKEDEFIYERSFYPGINILISDNHKGKSSILKCIKFALTGRNSLKSDVSGWIDQILLEFKIGDVTYTSYIDNGGKRVKAALYRASIDQYDADNIRDIDTVYSASSKEELERYCESFFYKQLGVNSLKWTQKDSRKEVNKLNEAGTSWVTFFKTIYLESKDSGTLFYGAQGDLLFQILLGLGMTTPINRLKVKKEMIQFELSKVNYLDINHKANNEKFVSILEKEIESYEEDLKNQKESLKEFDVGCMIEEKSSLVQEYQEIERKKILRIKKASEDEKIITNLISEEIRLDSDIKSLESQKVKIEKSILRIEEHIEIGSFFSNLEIKSCPSCNHTVEAVKSDSKNHSSCDLCHHEVNWPDRQEDVSRLEKKVILLREETDKINEQISIIEKAKKEVGDKISSAKQSHSYFDFSSEENKAKLLLSSIISIEQRIEENQQANSNKVNAIRDIEDNIAILKYRVKEAGNPADVDGKVREKGRSQDAINLLDSSIEYLKQYRASVNSAIVKEFKKITLNVLHSLGLESFTEIDIDSNLRISYIQGGNKLSYSEITEGEQLRVKIALYLALVQLNSEHGVGNHPRFLIIDSPGKEEADDKYFDGLIESLNTVENSFSDKIQILIGTADRRLSGIVADKKQEVKAKDEVFF